jgi:hypothetical protein
MEEPSGVICKHCGFWVRKLRREIIDK